jgi:CheY-like chemotaxis protein
VVVEDTGAGMSESVRLRIFDPFFTTKGVAGTGLGLSVSYGLLAKHKGEVTVRSREGEGTTFFLTFPAAVEKTAEPATPTAPGPPRAGRVLIIDDEAVLREAVTEALVLAGHRVEAAAGGREGILRFRPGEFDVVLTDLGMPEVSGLDVARAIKGVDPSVYVILCTGWGNVPGAEAPLRDRGVDLLLPKPFRVADVVAAVQAGVQARCAPAPAGRNAS